ncbi:tetratricopeptide repeat protein (plasmid) [Priestia megaterium]
MYVLNERDSSEKQKFLDAIKSNLTFSEAVLWNKIIRDIKVNVEDYSPATNEVSLGLAKKEAFFLVRSGYGNEALNYIEYVKSLIAELDSNYLDKNFYLNVEFEALIQIGRYDDAYELADVIFDNNSLSRKGLVEYLRGNYQEAKRLFDQYIGRSDSPDLQSIINYSAVLIALEDYSSAVSWCEKYIKQFDKDYLLCANLAYAYSEIDQLKSIYYYLISKDLEPDYKPAIQGLLINIKEIMDKQLPNLLEQIECSP